MDVATKFINWVEKVIKYNMELNEIKKTLYKESPKAVFNNVTKDGILYSAEVSGRIIYFRIPLSEVGDVAWTDKQEAKLLIRYII